ncbi:U8-theraphotoxin-Hhn1d-like [Watersipora subatra]|uniref:U8-theraphotoxin-Hhn1d-like n=1 Tax=Watersipora subatra TaxID=2589382 RepID=UPI00355B091C
MKSATLTTSIALVVLIAAVVCTELSRGRCNTNADCGCSQCCVELVRGKRFVPFVGAGVCRPLGQDGDLCYNREPEQNPHVNACPCHHSYKCIGTGRLEYHSGIWGHCQPL